MKDRDKTILNKIIEEAAAVSKMLDGIDEPSFLANDEKMRAVCMTLINIGELIKHLDADFRSNSQQIPWRKMAGLRDVAAHGYFTLKMYDIWIYAAKDLPVCDTQIKQILEDSSCQP
jgi:uncharacterized protein with HEPN domain